MSIVRAIGENDNGQTVDLAAGETVEIRLPENPMTGFRWIAASPAQSVCEGLDRSEFHPPEGLKPGAAGERVWQLRATASGTCNIDLRYLRLRQSPESAAKRFILHLRVR